MKKYTCLNCGAAFEADRFRKYCSVRCNRTYLQRDYRAKEKIPMDCLFNEGVACCDHTCDTCGWNPAVSQKRLEAISAKRGSSGELQ